MSLAPAGRNIYSHGVTKPKAPSERHGNEYAAPLGLFVVWVGGYNDVAPQQPVKGAELVGESPIRRIGRFATERPDACPCRKAGGEKQSRQRTDGPK